MPEAQRRLYRLTYESHASLPEHPDARLAALHDILKSARRRNIRCGVSGVLLYNQKAFFQTLEGNKAEVEQVFERIVHDTRHTDVKVLERKFVRSRIFHSWSMAYVEFPADATWSEQIVEELPAMLTGRTSKQADTRPH
jgi:hypothetical protein